MATANQIAYIDLLCDRLLEKELTTQQRKYVNWVSEFKYHFDKRWASEEIGKLKGIEGCARNATNGTTTNGTMKTGQASPKA